MQGLPSGRHVCPAFDPPICAALKAGGRELALELRPASRDHLSLLAPTIAVPNFVEGLGELYC